MDLKQQAQYLRGFLDSLSSSKSISKNQIELLSDKLLKIIATIEESEDDFEIYREPVQKVHSAQIVKKLPSWNEEEHDDLPF